MSSPSYYAQVPEEAVAQQLPEILEGLASGHYARVFIMRGGVAVAELGPVTVDLPEGWGAGRGTAIVAPGVDLTRPTFVEDEEADLEPADH